MSPELSWNFAKAYTMENSYIARYPSPRLGRLRIGNLSPENSLSELNQSLKLLEKLSSDDADYLEAFSGIKNSHFLTSENFGFE